MEYEFFVSKEVDKDILKKYMPGEIFAEVAYLPLLTFCATLKGKKKTEKNPIGYAFFLMGEPARLIWTKVDEEFYGTDLAHTLLEYAEGYLRDENVSGIFASLYGDYFSTYQGNSFLDKNEFDVVKQNKRLITYRKELISESPVVKALCQRGEKLCANVVPLDHNKQRHKACLLKNAGDIRTDNQECIDTEHSFAYMKDNKVAGFAFCVRRRESEVYVADFYAAKDETGPEATKGLLIALLKKCIEKKDLSFVIENEAQRNLFIQLIGDPDRDVPFWEYYKGLHGREDDIDE